MPHIPDNAHDTHDLELVAAYAAGDAEAIGLERATTLVATCTECAALHHDLRAIAAALPELPAPVRPRDFRLTPEQAASLRPGGIRGLLAAFSGPRFAFATPLGTGLAALGIVGVLVASGGLATPQATGERNAQGAVTAPEVAPAPSAAMFGAAEAASPAAASEAPGMLAAPSGNANTGISQKASPADNAVGTGPADGTTIAADAPDTGSSPLAALSVLVVFLGCALLGARLVARRLARAP